MEIHDLQERQSTMDTGVYLPVDDGDITQKIDYPKLARAIIEQYTASSLGGSYRSVKSALDTIKTSVDDAVKTSDVANNVTTTASGKVLDARQGKVLKDGIDLLNSKDVRTTVSVAKGATVQYDFGSEQTYRILLTGHNSVAGFRGLYILLPNNINPVIPASNYTVSVSGTTATITNTASAGTVVGVIV